MVWQFGFIWGNPVIALPVEGKLSKFIVCRPWPRHEICGKNHLDRSSDFCRKQKHY